MQTLPEAACGLAAVPGHSVVGEPFTMWTAGFAASGMLKDSGMYRRVPEEIPANVPNSVAPFGKVLVKPVVPLVPLVPLAPFRPFAPLAPFLPLAPGAPAGPRIPWLLKEILFSLLRHLVDRLTSRMAPDFFTHPK